MTDQEIFALFKARLVNADLGLTIVEPNDDSFPVKPYFVVDLSVVNRTNRCLSGGTEQAMGVCQITLVSETGEGDSTSRAKAQEVIAIFPYGLRMGSEVLVDQPTKAQNGYRDGSDWRTPVMINFLAQTL